MLQSAQVAQIVQNLTTTSRKTRKPKHSWQVSHKPWTIQPICIAPVMPGDTLTSALYQSRVVTDPVKNPLVGGWIEYYWFYVKLRDLDARDTITNLMLDPAANLSSLHTAAKADTYHYAASVDWAQLCLNRVVKEYFRDEPEAYDAGGPGVVEGMPLAKVVSPGENWLDSAINQATTGNPNNLQDPHDDVQIAAYQAAYDKMREMRMIDMDFDDWLGTFGISVRKDEQKHIPELLRYHRDWTYPANTVEPTTGVPSSALSWAVSDRLDKDRFFREPGFIFGVSIFRPKIYLGNQQGAAVHMLETAESWLPAMLGDQPWTSLRKFTSGTGPITGQAATPGGDYWVDVRDLFLYGDQFINMTRDGAANAVALPGSGFLKAYVTEAMRTGLFMTAGKNLVKQDGVINFTIKSSPMVATDQT